MPCIVGLAPQDDGFGTSLNSHDMARVEAYPRRRAFTAIAISVRWAMAAASVDCLRVSSAAVASCSIMAASLAALKLRSAVSTMGFREKCRRGYPPSSTAEAGVPSAMASADLCSHAAWRCAAEMLTPG